MDTTVTIRIRYLGAFADAVRSKEESCQLASPRVSALIDYLLDRNGEKFRKLMIDPSTGALRGGTTGAFRRRRGHITDAARRRQDGLKARKQWCRPTRDSGCFLRKQQNEGISRMHGYGDLVRIDLTSGSVRWESLPPELVKKFIGGMGINDWLLWQHFLKVDLHIDPMSEDNVLIGCDGLRVGQQDEVHVQVAGDGLLR
jgi:hypothetical protein